MTAVGSPRAGRAARLLQHLVAQALGAAAAAACCAVVAVVGYIVLFVIAATIGGGLGGPLALPGLVLMAVAASVVISTTCVWPASLAARLAGRRLGLHRALELSLAGAFALVPSVTIALVLSSLAQGELGPWLAIGATVSAALPILVVHWTVARLVEHALDAGRGLVGAGADPSDELPV
jgi:hypothetical protein